MGLYIVPCCGTICSLQVYHIWGSNLTHMKNEFRINSSMNTNAPPDSFWTTIRSHTWMTVLYWLFLARLKKNVGSYLTQKERSTRYSVRASSLLAGRKLHFPRQITFKRL